MLVICRTCETVFSKSPSEIAKTRNNFCSRSCSARFNNAKYPKRKKKVYQKVCKGCGNVFDNIGYNQSVNRVYCSPNCRPITRKVLSIPERLEDPNRKLDKRLGYVRIYVPEHPKSNTRGYYYEHRVIMEQELGRYLTSDEHVHHKNGIRHDNRVENLEVMSKFEHGKLMKYGGQRPEDL